MTERLDLEAIERAIAQVEPIGYPMTFGEWATQRAALRGAVALNAEVRRLVAASVEACRAGRGLSSLIDESTKAERERCLGAVAWVRALYPECAFPPDGKSQDAISGTWARQVCDNIRRGIEEAE